MKLLNDEQQIELQQLIEEVRFSNDLTVNQHAQLNYWSTELKPKRKKRVKTEKSVDTQSE